jgi:hypothetical protein
MAGRPIKQGIDYFPFDVNFYADVKVRKIAKACGPNSVAVIISLLCNIYREKGYYILWDDDLPFFIADEVGVSEGCVHEVIKKALQVGFFDVDKYSAHRILTSAGIQKRFFEITKRRTDIETNSEYLINGCNNSISAYKNSVNDDKNMSEKRVKTSTEKTDGAINVDNNSIIVCKNSINAYRNAAKVKESKYKENSNTPNVVLEKKKAAEAATLSRKEKFGQSLIPYVEKYGKEMIRDFFDYWSEFNKSKSKMRFEQQPTWETSKRLATWAKRDKNYNHAKDTGGHEDKRRSYDVSSDVEKDYNSTF